MTNAGAVEKTFERLNEALAGFFSVGMSMHPRDAAQAILREIETGQFAVKFEIDFRRAEISAKCYGVRESESHLLFELVDERRPHFWWAEIAEAN